MILYLVLALHYLALQTSDSKIPPAKVVILPQPDSVNATTGAGDLFMRKIIVYSKKRGRQEILLDDKDFLKVSKYKWSVRKSGRTLYAGRNAGKILSYVTIHRFILGFPKGRIDHADGNGLNNQRSNLRKCSHAENMRNQRITIRNTSGYKGVSWDKERKMFTCFISKNYKHIFCGRFDSAKEAAKMYNRMAVKFHGKFARLNKM